MSGARRRRTGCRRALPDSAGTHQSGGPLDGGSRTVAASLGHSRTVGVRRGERVVQCVSPCLRRSTHDWVARGTWVCAVSVGGVSCGTPCCCRGSCRSALSCRSLRYAACSRGLRGLRARSVTGGDAMGPQSGSHRHTRPNRQPATVCDVRGDRISGWRRVGPARVARSLTRSVVPCAPLLGVVDGGLALVTLSSVRSAHARCPSHSALNPRTTESCGR